MEKTSRVVGRYRNTENPFGEIGQQIEAAIESVGAYCSEVLGLDVSGSLPAARTIGLFDSGTFAKQAELTGVHGGGVEASTSMTGSILLKLVERPALLRNLVHEVGHDIAPRAFNIVPNDDASPSLRGRRWGYVTSHTVAGGTAAKFAGLKLEEVLIESMVLDVVETQWAKNQLLGPFVGKVGVCYQQEVVVADALFKHVSQELGVPPVEYLRDLQRGRLTGDMKALRPTLEVLGQRRSIALFEWGYATAGKKDPMSTDLDTPDQRLINRESVDAQRMASRLGLGSEVERPLARLDAGYKTPVMQYLMPNASAKLAGPVQGIGL